MSSNLSRLLGRSQDEIRKSLSILEEKCGFPSEDVRLLAENRHRLRAKVQQLGLDADDTTDSELYHAVRARFSRDSQMLDKALGVDKHTKLAERLAKAAQLVNHCAATDEVWVAKNSAAKLALAKSPPKQVAKTLNYRSVASMLKRQDIAEIYLAASAVESANWQKNIGKHLAALNASHYELRTIKIINLPAERWSAVDAPPPVVVNKSIGAAALWPASELKKASILCLTLLLLEGVQSLNPDGYNEALPELSPALRWWADTAHLISDGAQPVSLNVRDVSLNHLSNHELLLSVRHHGAKSLWDELSARYQTISASLSDRVGRIEPEIKRSKMPLASELATEYASLE